MENIKRELEIRKVEIRNYIDFIKKSDKHEQGLFDLNNINTEIEG